MAEKKKTNKAVTKPKPQAMELKLTPANVVQYINPHVSKEEVALFLNQCQMFGLNPFKREIYLIKYSQKDPAQFVVGYEVYLKRAHRSKNWDGIAFGTNGSGSAMTAWCKVYRKDWKEPLFHEVDFEEYAQRKSDGSLNRFWEKKPKTMLKKVVLAQALRMAFPDEYAGMPYIVEEVSDIDMHRLPDGQDRYYDDKKVENNFKPEDLKKEEMTDPPTEYVRDEVTREETRPVTAEFPPEQDEEEAPAEEEKEAPQSMKMDINRLMSTLVDKYGIAPETILEKMDAKIGSHNINELSEKKAQETIEYFKWAIDQMEKKNADKQPRS
jgi:phage recombination protein Bet